MRLLSLPQPTNPSSRDLKDKLKEWVSNHNLVSWHADAANWANPPVPVFFVPNFRLQIPPTSRTYNRTPQNSLADERAVRKDCPLTTMLWSDAGGKPPIHQNVTKIGPDPSSTGSNTMPHSDRSAATNTASEDAVPVTSEYLQTMTPTLDSTGIVNEALCLTNLSDNWTQGKLTSKRLDTFAKVALPSNVQIQLAQPFVVFIVPCHKVPRKGISASATAPDDAKEIRRRRLLTFARIPRGLGINNNHSYRLEVNDVGMSTSL
ncbi:hypothetical protein MHU86_5089 [Fragilaria crotonensis]|nr:hypothetical protein MHU86_5089 [Fragilaria crotonensis]